MNGIEYAFGGHDVPGRTGVWTQRPGHLPSDANIPGQQQGQHGPKFHSAHDIGTALMTPSHLRQLVRRLEREWPGQSYHLIQRNCNHFADEVGLD